MACVAVALSLSSAASAGEIGRNIEALVGKAAAELLAREYGTLDNPLLTEWVDSIGQRVARPCPRQEFPFRLRILDTPEANAFALPGAHIFVTRGLLARVRSEDELAGILAHEVGHVADRDFQRLLARQLLFLGLGEALEGMDQEELVTPLRVVQLFNTLRHSRRQEDQADLRGVEYALAARYDPIALTAFFDIVLRGRARPRPWYRGVLKTHPDAYTRRRRTIERTQRLGAADPSALLAVADDLRQRYRYSAALRTQALTHEIAPGDIRPLVAAAELYLLRGEPEECVLACRRALLVSPADPAILRLADEAERLVDASPVSEPPADVEPAEIGLDRDALERLRRFAHALERDRRFNDALLWAQAYRPEVEDWRWVFLAVKVRLLLMAVDRLRRRVAEVGRLAESGAEAWERTPAPTDAAIADRAAECYNKGVRRGIDAAENLRTAMRLLPLVLASLVLTGNGDPFGRMNGTRFTLLEADLVVAEERARHALEQCRGSARDVAMAEADRLACGLDAMETSAGERQRTIYRGLASARLGLTAEAMRERSQEAGGLGAACRAIVLERAEADLETGPSDLTYEQAESVRIALNVLTWEAKTETIRATQMTDDAG